MSDTQREKPPVPTLVTIIAVLVAVLVVGGAFLLGRVLGTEPEPTPEPTETPTLTAPQMLGELPLTKSEPSEVATGVHKQILHSTYTDGTQQVLLVQSEPEESVEDFLANAGVTDARDASEFGYQRGEGDPEVLCGISEDTGSAACGRIVDEEGQLLLSVAQADATTLIQLLDTL